MSGKQLQITYGDAVLFDGVVGAIQWTEEDDGGVAVLAKPPGVPMSSKTKSGIGNGIMEALMQASKGATERKRAEVIGGQPDMSE